MKTSIMLVFTLCAAACGGKAGGSCNYTETAGTCTVTHVSASTDGSDPTTFDFATTGSNTSDTGVFENGSEDANQACSVGAGLTESSAHACTMHTIESGTSCTPTFFTIDGSNAATTAGCH